MDEDDQIVMHPEPEMRPTVDEFPEADVSDLVRRFEENRVQQS